MEFLHIYLLVAAAVSCVTAIFVTKVLQRTTILQGNGNTVAQKYSHFPAGSLSFKGQRSCREMGILLCNSTLKNWNITFAEAKLVLQYSSFW